MSDIAVDEGGGTGIYTVIRRKRVGDPEQRKGDKRQEYCDRQPYLLVLQTACTYPERRFKRQARFYRTENSVGIACDLRFVGFSEILCVFF